MTYDCFSFFNELDLLEIRFNILDKYVDYFVLGQSTETFSGKEKPLYFDINDPRWAKWRHKIIEVVSPKLSGVNSFERAFHQKEFLKTGLTNAKDTDIIYYGDLDEIWRPPFFASVLYDVGEIVYSLKQLNYCYRIGNRSSEEWIGTVVGHWGKIKTNTLAYWRATHTNVLDNGGWHFTNMGGVEQVLKKLDAYDHQEFNNEDVRSQVAERMANGKDYVGRGADWLGRPFQMWQDESELPDYIIQNKKKYEHLFKE